MTEVVIRKAVVNDAQAICNIWKVITSEKIFSSIDRPFTLKQEIEYIKSLSDREAIFLAELNGKIVGFQSIDLFSKFILSMSQVGTLGTYILPEYRGKGIGKKLFEESLKFAREFKYEKLVIYVRETNTSALSFYQSLGFKPKGKLEKQVKIEGIYDNEIFLELFL